MSKNRISTTLSPYHHKLVKGAAKASGISESRIIADAVKKQFDQLPPGERERILNKG